MATGFRIDSIDLDGLCEPARGNNHANLGLSAGRFVGSGGDLNTRYASYPAGYGYALYAWPPESDPYPFKVDGTEIVPPSALGHRPSLSKIIDLTTPGTWRLWRTAEAVMLQSPSATQSTFPASEFGLASPPAILCYEIVAGGGGGGGGNGSRAAGGGGGGAFIAGWLAIPLAQAYTDGLVLVVGGAGAGGSGGNGSSGYGSDGGPSYIRDKAGAEFCRAYGGTSGSNVDSDDNGDGGGTSVSDGRSFVAVSGGRGGDDGSVDGYSVSISYSYRPEDSVSYHFAGGASPASPGGGGAGGGGVGGSGGGSGGAGQAPSSGYGGAGGGGNYKWFDGKSGGNGAAGRIRLFY